MARKTRTSKIRKLANKVKSVAKGSHRGSRNRSSM